MGAHLLTLSAALVLDRLFGDPAWLWTRLPHPVAVMGRIIAGLDAWLNDPRRGFETRRRLGVLAMLLLIAAAGVLGAALDFILSLLPIGLGVEAILVAVFLAQKSLVDHVSAVGQALVSRGIEGGRQAVAHIVGRDVTRLDKAGVARGAIESAAENFSDGVVAPAFWYALLGLPGLLIFKLVNTADSMLGDLSPPHAAFGWAAARTDDLLNFVPARLSALLIAVAGTLIGANMRSAATVALRDARTHVSPNAGWPEAAMAGALGLALGGPRRYGEIEVDGAWLNAAGRSDSGPDDLKAALRLVDAAWGLLLLLVTLGGLIALALAR